MANQITWDTSGVEPQFITGYKSSQDYTTGVLRGDGDLTMVLSGSAARDNANDEHINERMNTRVCCVDVYMQFIPANGATRTSATSMRRSPPSSRGPATTCTSTAGASSCGKGRDDAQDLRVGTGAFIYIPPYVAHKRVNTSDVEARVIVCTRRMIKAIGLDRFDQLEPAEGFEDIWVPSAD